MERFIVGFFFIFATDKFFLKFIWSVIQSEDNGTQILHEYNQSVT